MGKDFSYKCRKCGAEGSISLGVGMCYPGFCVEEKERALRGDLGEQAKAAVRNDPTGMFDCTEVIYKCECGYWESDRKHEYRVPNSRAPVDGFYDELNERNSRLVWKKPHPCPKCGKEMKRYRGDVSGLKCPECGGELVALPALMWD